MAKKYIDVDECREEFVSAVFDILSKDKDNLNANLIVDAFDDMPAADVEPVRHGKWKETTSCGKQNDLEYQKADTVFRCSECGYDFEHEGYLAYFNYCPNCGARMDGDNNDTQ